MIPQMIHYLFTIVGRPKGKDRPRFSKDGHTYTTRKTKEYEDLIKYIFRIEKHGKMIPEGRRIAVTISANFKIPSSDNKAEAEKKRRGITQATIKPDVDNIAKIVLDALNGIAYRDDSEVVELHVYKQYAEKNDVKVEVVGLDPEAL